MTRLTVIIMGFNYGDVPIAFEWKLTEQYFI